MIRPDRWLLARLEAAARHQQSRLQIKAITTPEDWPAVERTLDDIERL